MNSTSPARSTPAAVAPTHGVVKKGGRGQRHRGITPNQNHPPTNRKERARTNSEPQVHRDFHTRWRGEGGEAMGRSPLTRARGKFSNREIPSLAGVTRRDRSEVALRA